MTMMTWTLATLGAAAIASLALTSAFWVFEKQHRKSTQNENSCREALRKIALDLEAGHISATEAGTARDLAIAGALKGPRQPLMPASLLAPRARAIAMAAAVGLIVATSSMLFVLRPNSAASGAANSATTADPVEVLAKLTTLSPTAMLSPTMPSLAAKSVPPQQLPSVDEMIVRLVQRLERQPNDVAGWKMLGWSRFSTGRYADAVTSYAKAVALAPDTASLQSAYGEALVKASGGTVTDEARVAFDKAAKLDPSDVRARFHLALAQAQSGQKQSALEAWLSLAQDVDAETMGRLGLSEKITALGAETGTDVAA
ncbi:MAG: tetratricopeptide repeat protein, partial [Hyphomicrobiaceae bacterium]